MPFEKNANYYSGILAKTLQEVNIIDKTLLVKEDVQLIKSTLDQMPSAQAIKNLKRYLTRYEISLNNYRSQIKKASHKRDKRKIYYYSNVKLHVSVWASKPDSKRVYP
ncbi:MAG: hypothetical protein Q6351_009970 [Candidatus Njordarchaeum guaymaensis]